MAGYGTDVDLKSYWDEAGYTYASDAPFGALRQRGSTYIDATYGERFPGEPTGGIDQERAWPRVWGNSLRFGASSTVIPQRVKSASYEAAYLEVTAPGSLAVTVDPAKRVKRQKIDTIEREFFQPGAPDFWAPNAPVSSVIEGLLAPLLGPSIPGPAILVV